MSGKHINYKKCYDGYCPKEYNISRGSSPIKKGLFRVNTTVAAVRAHLHLNDLFLIINVFTITFTYLMQYYEPFGIFRVGLHG